MLFKLMSIFPQIVAFLNKISIFVLYPYKNIVSIIFDLFVDLGRSDQLLAQIISMSNQVLLNCQLAVFFQRF